MEAARTVLIPSREDFLKTARRGDLVPIYREILADRLTPVSAFEKIAGDRNSFLLESVEGGETIARYSFLGSDPFLLLHYRDGQPANFMQNLRATMARYKAVKVPNLPPFTGGAVGYFGYDMVRTIEDIPNTGIDDL